MKSYNLQTTPDNLEAALESWKDKGIQLILLFGPTAALKDGSLNRKVSALFPDADIIGCSSSGEIGDRVEDGSISMLGLVFEKSSFRYASVQIENAESSKEAGIELAKKLMADDLAGVFLLLPGVNVNGSKFTAGLKEVLPPGTSISGGMAGDGLNFKETVTIHNDEAFGNHAVAFGVYGDKVKISSGSRGGWKPFGPQRRVTRAKDNILYEIDGKPALELYKEYLGEKASDLPSSGLLYPFAIMQQDRTDAFGLIRTILDIDEENNSLVLAGDLDVGQYVCLMHANTDELVDGAENAARTVLGDGASADDDSAVICVSCVGRKILMGDDTEDELDAVRAVFGDQEKIAGFYSYGEICFFEDTGEPELHNQTMTITYITEEAA